MFCYALISTCKRYTYVGKTNNLTRRLRQHNGEIKGGAKATRRGRPWSIILYVAGFESTSQALCFEWRWHHKRARGIKGVVKGLEKTINRPKWTLKCPDACTIPLTIHTTDLELLEKIKVPTFVAITELTD